MKPRELIGSGDKIAKTALPPLAIGLALNIVHPHIFAVGGPPAGLRTASVIVLVVGLAVWAWSAVLVLTSVPRKKLIKSGPYSIVKHPLYTGVSLLVLPWIGFLLNSWLGTLAGIVFYVVSRIFAPEEEQALSRSFGHAWDDYCRMVKIPWL